MRGFSFQSRETPRIRNLQMENTPDYSRKIFYILLFLGVIVGMTVLKLTATFFVPLTISVLLSFVFYPMIKMMHKIRIPWVLCIIICVIFAFVAFFILGNLLVASMKTVLSTYPRYEQRFTSLYKMFADLFKIPFDVNSSLIVNLWNSLGVRSLVQTTVISVSNYTLSVAKIALMITLFVVFLLIEMRELKGKVRHAFPEEHLNKKIVIIAMKIISEVTRYISIKFIISFLTGLLVFISCLCMRLDFAIIWGFLAFALNFIPNFGSIISWFITTSFAILQFYPSIGKIVFIAASILAINFILGNIIEPRWTGSDLGISPFIILVGLSLWGWIWGFVGMILSVPIMVILKIILENINFLSPIAILMGNSPSKKNQKKK